MFRITRGHHIQHIHFPFPVIRDLDGDGGEEKREDAAPPESAAPVAQQDDTVDADPSADAGQ